MLECRFNKTTHHHVITVLRGKGVALHLATAINHIYVYIAYILHIQSEKRAISTLHQAHAHGGGGGGGGGVYYQTVTGETRTTPFRVTTAQTAPLCRVLCP